MGEEHVSDLIPAYILSCLDSEEISQVQEHLNSCAECMRELKSYEPVIEALAFLPQQISPSPSHKEILLKSINDSGYENTTLQTNPSVFHGLANSISRRLAQVLPVWSSISLVLVIALAITSFILFRQVRDKTPDNAPIPSAFTMIPLSGTSSAPDAIGVMIITNHGLRGDLNVDGLQPLDSEHQYQLWLSQEGNRTNGGVFSVSPQGFGTLGINSSIPLVEYETFGITIEPAGGSTGPTGEMVLDGGL